MAKDCSFDVVSEIDMQEMDNAVNQTLKEIQQRYDFKGSKASLSLEKDGLKLTAEDEYKLDAMLDILRNKMVKRGVPLKALKPGKIEAGAGGAVRQLITLQKGIDKENGKEIVNTVKSLKLKVQAQIMDDQVRVTGAKRDDLQAVIQHLKSKDFPVELQFVNLRS